MKPEPAPRWSKASPDNESGGTPNRSRNSRSASASGLPAVGSLALPITSTFTTASPWRSTSEAKSGSVPARLVRDFSGLEYWRASSDAMMPLRGTASSREHPASGIAASSARQMGLRQRTRIPCAPRSARDLDAAPLEVARYRHRDLENAVTHRGFRLLGLRALGQRNVAVKAAVAALGEVVAALAIALGVRFLALAGERDAVARAFDLDRIARYAGKVRTDHDALALAPHVNARRPRGRRTAVRRGFGTAGEKRFDDAIDLAGNLQQAGDGVLAPGCARSRAPRIATGGIVRLPRPGLPGAVVRR